MKKGLVLLLYIQFCLTVLAQSFQPEFSVAGFFPVENSGREVYSMNPSWRFYKGEVSGAEKVDFDDSGWGRVSLPHSVDTLPSEASGCANYQGVSWYRKHFSVKPGLLGKKLFVYFEAVMGKTRVWVNGELCATHYGGYLPIILDVTDKLGEENVIAVCTDNSNDPLYPPGKPQEFLDFTYSGGIYRDCWLIAHNRVFITDENYASEVAGGGTFVSYGRVSEKSADLQLKVQLKNETKQSFKGKVHVTLCSPSGETVCKKVSSVQIPSGKNGYCHARIEVKNPRLWYPSSPSLYQVYIEVKDTKTGKTIDGYRKKIGIRSIEFKGKDGLWVNGKPYPRPLMGANRHQDFAVVGNAMTNNLHWRDAKKLKDLGLEIIRNAHYPQDPAFMDACDALGLFVIENTPGWQFWNEDPIFQTRVFDDIRNIIRRDRNRPSVFLWEPILNETWYPESFVDSVAQIVADEYPYPYSHIVGDSEARGASRFSVLYAHPSNGDTDIAIKNLNPDVSYFTREWGDNVDDWNSHNSTSRVKRCWGETPMLVQATHYASPSYTCTNYDVLWKTPKQHFGGCLWHSFDHQRGYHPDPFYGGLADVFRQPKYSYYMFMAQRPLDSLDIQAESGPMIYIAHEMTPFSPADVTIYSNCEEVRLTVFQGGKTYVYKKEIRAGMPSPVIVFKDVYRFMDDKALSRKERQDEVFLLAEGFQDGKKVAEHKRRPARRPAKIVLQLDTEGIGPVADGSDLVTVIASVTDEDGLVKRLNNYHIRFSVEGEGRLLADESSHTNPRPVEWGTAPVLLRTTLRPGKVKIKAEVDSPGLQMPLRGELEFDVLPATHVSIYDEEEREGVMRPVSTVNRSNETEMRNKLNQELKNVERQQTEFGE